jgi:indole-3-glycerol phosphate synthase
MPDHLKKFARDAWRRLGQGYYRFPRGRLRATLSLTEAVRDHRGKAVIAEVKPRSPSRGNLLSGRSPGEVARLYQAGGAVGISVLADPDHFGGSLELLRRFAGLRLPLLAKDFVVAEEQLKAFRNAGADCVLLIQPLFARGYASCELREMIRAAHSYGLEVLVEVWDAPGLREALESDADLIGINSRDLTTLEVDIQRPIRVLREVAPRHTRPILALSGISSPADIRALREAGFSGFLVGTALLTAEDPRAKLEELIRA